MYKIDIKNAVVEDDGYGLTVNGKPLAEMISIILGTMVKTKEEGTVRANSWEKRLKQFHSNSCDITLIIEPHPTVETIETEQYEYENWSEVEEDMYEQFEQKCKTADTEE